MRRKKAKCQNLVDFRKKTGEVGLKCEIIDVIVPNPIDPGQSKEISRHVVGVVMEDYVDKTHGTLLLWFLWLV